MAKLLLCDDGRVSTVAPRCAHHGYGIEMQAFVDPGALDLDSPLFRVHERAIAGVELRAVHGPFGDLVPGSFDPLVRDLARWRIDQGAAAATRLGATHLVLHHGYVPGTSEPARWLDRSIRFWRSVLKAWPGVRIHLENHLEPGPELILNLLEAVAHPRLDVCLDLGHARCYSQTPPLEWIRRLGQRIGYVHLHDNDGREDTHLALGRGRIPWEDSCRALLATAPGALWALEVGPAALDESLGWLRARGFLPARK